MKHALRIYGPACLLVLLAFVVAYQFIKPAPPQHVRIASGNPQGAYYAFAQAYARELRKEGVSLEVIATAGSVDNIQLLHEGKVDVALVQGGIADAKGEKDTPGLYSLGSLYHEPLWLFVRRDLAVGDLRSLAGYRVATGEGGSGTRVLAMRLLHDNGVTAANTRLLALDSRAAASGLQHGELDAAIFVASPESPLVQSLLHDPGIYPVSFDRAEAYARRYRFLSAITLPRGVVDLEQDIPAQDVRLLAPAANLVVSDASHPAINDLLLQATQRVHAEGDWFSARGEFPKPDLLAFPLAREAERFYRNGPPFLQRYLPFWAASLVDRLKVMLLPLVLMLLPFFKLMPPIYQWRMGSKIYRWYDDLEQLETDMHAAASADRAVLVERLDRIEGEVRRIEVPSAYGRQLYHLRQHIELVRSRLESGHD